MLVSEHIREKNAVISAISPISSEIEEKYGAILSNLRRTAVFGTIHRTIRT